MAAVPVCNFTSDIRSHHGLSGERKPYARQQCGLPLRQIVVYPLQQRLVVRAERIGIETAALCDGKCFFLCKAVHVKAAARQLFCLHLVVEARFAQFGIQFACFEGAVIFRLACVFPCTGATCLVLDFALFQGGVVLSYGKTFFFLLLTNFRSKFRFTRGKLVVKISNPFGVPCVEILLCGGKDGTLVCVVGVFLVDVVVLLGKQTLFGGINNAAELQSVVGKTTMSRCHVTVVGGKQFCKV